MRVVVLVCNFLLLGFACLGILTRSSSYEFSSIILAMSMLAVPIMNIVMISGSRLTLNVKDKLAVRGSINNWFTNRIVRIFAAFLNIVLIGFVYWAVHREFTNSSGYLIIIITSFVIFTPILSIIIILLSRWNMFKGFRRTILITGMSLVVLFLGFFFIMRILIGHELQANIDIVRNQYPGKAEDALIAYLSDSTNSPRDRTEIAIWTLGQIRSSKALPVLKDLYKNDPEGNTCRGKHNSALCQYEIHKAIISIENNWLGAKEKNWFGSWARLNK